MRNLGADFMGPLPQVSPKIAIKLLAGAVDISASTGERLTFKFPHESVRRSQYFMGCLADGLSAFTATGWQKASFYSLPHWPLHKAAHNIATCFNRVGNREAQRKREKTAITVFYNLT